jgi:D-sedoheptulose 7-phosphate isomerase
MKMDKQIIRGEIAAQLEASASLKQELAKNYIDVISQITTEICRSLKSGGKIILFGNGGSAADAQHIASELVGRFKKERPGLRALSLSANTSLLTSLSNDFDFSQIFSRQVECLADPADVVIGITTSGGSENVLLALQAGAEIGATTVCLSGMDGGECAKASQISIIIPSYDVPRIQEAHIAVGHIICHLVEEELFASQDD